jgi:hypothetical protein
VVLPWSGQRYVKGPLKWFAQKCVQWGIVTLYTCWIVQKYHLNTIGCFYFERMAKLFGFDLFDEDSTMGNGLWFITILKDNPWIGIIAGILLFLLFFVFKKWLFAKLMKGEEEG